MFCPALSRKGSLLCRTFLAKDIKEALEFSLKLNVDILFPIPLGERFQIHKKFVRGQIDVLITCDAFTEGLRASIPRRFTCFHPRPLPGSSLEEEVNWFVADGQIPPRSTTSSRSRHAWGSMIPCRRKSLCGAPRVLELSTRKRC